MYNSLIKTFTSNFRKRIFWEQVSLFTGLLILMYLWYKPYTQIFPYADDLRAIRAISSSSLGHLLSTATINYRPVFTIVLYFLIKVFGYHTNIYFIFNILLNNITALFIYKKMKSISKSHYIGIVFSLLYIISNFGLYGIVQIEGTMEILCQLLLFIFLSSIYDMIYQSSKTLKYFYIALLSYTLIIFTHERFIVLFVPLITTIIIKYKQLPKKIYILLFLSIIPMILNVFIKKSIFKIVFFRGTGGRVITLSVPMAILHIKNHIQYLLGIHNADVYLNGISSRDVLGLINIIIIISVISITVIIILYSSIIRDIRKISIEAKNSLFFTLICFITIALMIASSSGTIRVEQRWVYAPYTVLLFMLSHIFCVSKEFFTVFIKNNSKSGLHFSLLVKIILPFLPLAVFLVSTDKNFHVDKETWKIFTTVILFIGLLSMITIINKEKIARWFITIGLFVKNVFMCNIDHILNIMLFLYLITTFSYSLYYREYFDKIFFIEWHKRAEKIFELKYKIGKQIAMGTSYENYTPESTKYIISGLSVEDWHSWSNDEAVGLTFFLDEVKNDLVFIADVDLLLDTEKVQLYVNNDFVDSMILSKSELNQMRFNINKKYLYYGPNDFKFVFPDAISPAEIGINEDVRKLAVGFRNFVLEKIDTFAIPEINDEIFK